MMRIRFACRDEQCPALIEYRPLGTGDETFACPRCRREYTLRDTATLVRDRTLRKCALCGGEEMFIRKNFPQITGLLIVLVAGLISFLYLRTNAALAYGVLAAAMLADVIIYYLIGVVTVCYRCRTEYWGASRSKNHDWFDLAASEKYL
jgi:hypothetical protein